MNSSVAEYNASTTNNILTVDTVVALLSFSGTYSKQSDVCHCANQWQRRGACSTILLQTRIRSEEPFSWVCNRFLNLTIPNTSAVL